MTPRIPDIDEGDLLLAEAAKLDMALARDLHARALATEDNYEAAALARAYQGQTRSMRQNLAGLDKRREARVRAARDAAREAEAARPRRDEGRLTLRHGEVRAAVRRVMFHETERERHDELWDWIDERLDFDRLPDDFADQPLDEQIVDICVEMGVDRDVAVHWRETPEVAEILDEDDPGRPDGDLKPTFVYGDEDEEEAQPAVEPSG